jgi:hypothetical protein
MILETFPVGPLACNCTILGDEEAGEAIVIDPGDEVGRIHRRLTELGLKLKQILVTHAHIDHVGGALKLKRLTGAPILLNENDLPLLKMMDYPGRLARRGPPETAPPDESLDDGQIVGLERYPAQVSTLPATPRARSASTLPRSSCSSPATRSLPAASAAPTCPAATSTRSSTPSSPACWPCPTKPKFCPATAPQPPSAQSARATHSCAGFDLAMPFR